MTTEHEMVERVEMLYQYVMKVFNQYFSAFHSSSEETEMQKSLRLVLQQQYPPKPFLEKFMDGVKNRNTQMFMFSNVYDKYKTLLASLQQELPELFEQYTPLRFQGDFSPEPAFHSLVNEVNFLKNKVSHVVDKKIYLDGVGREGIFFAGQSFDAWKHISSMLTLATAQIIIIDGYVNNKVLQQLATLNFHHDLHILTTGTYINQSFKTEAKLFNKQYGPLTLKISNDFHDRFIIIDRKEYFHLGASIKDAGDKRGFMFSKIEEPTVIEALQTKFDTIWTTTNEEIFL